MALFTSKQGTLSRVDQGSEEPISSILADSFQVVGEIRFKGKTRIDGQVQGNVQGDYLVLSETGRIVGDVTVETLVCHGMIDGNIMAATVTARATADIRGRLCAGNLTVESGASLNGEIKAMEKQQDKALTHPPQPLKLQAGTEASKAA
jgi:cytoskeletal protein CcmA (bactofilin family)